MMDSRTSCRGTAARDGEDLVVTLKMRSVTNSWNPTNGFDHLRLSLYLAQANGTTGNTVLPFSQGNTPIGFSWGMLSVIDGWNNSLYQGQPRPAALAARFPACHRSRPMRLLAPSHCVIQPTCWAALRR